jgi:hypothetical protein
LQRKEIIMLVLRGIIGGIFLFLGRELNFLFAAAMAALMALRLTPILPFTWPQWSDYVFILALAVLAAVIVLFNKRAGYFISGFLVGSSFLVELYEPGALTLPLFPFLVGGVIGSLIMGIFTEWALIVISCLVGAYFLINLFILPNTQRLLVGAGLFIIGALTQVVLMQMQQRDE